MNKKILIRKLKKAEACKEGLDWLESQKETDIKKLALKAIKENHADWVNWAIVRIMTYKQYVSYGVYDLILKVNAASMEELKQLVTHRLRSIDNVRSTLTLMLTEE